MLGNSSLIGRVAVTRSFIRLNNTAAYNEAVEAIRTDLKINFRSKADVMEKNVIRSILTEVKNLEIKNYNKQDNDKFQLYELFAKMIKERQNTAKEYMAKGNPDRFFQLGENELRECDYIEKYLKNLGMISNEVLEQKLLKVIDELEEAGEEVNLKNIYKKVPLKKVEKEWNCSRLQIKDVLNKLLNLN